MKKRGIWAAAFACYCLLMLWLLFDRSGYRPGIPYSQQLRWNLVPFETVRLFFRLLTSANPGYRMHAIVNLGGNVLMFVPLGFLLPKVFPALHTLKRVAMTTAVIIICVELTQLFTLLGSCDTDDLILNVIGSAIGFGLFKMRNKGAA